MSFVDCVHLLTGEYPPATGGVGDYTALLAAGLARAGRDVHVWCPHASPSTAPGLTVHALPDRFGQASRRVLTRAFGTQPGGVLLQYVPNALGFRGANVLFCRWLAAQRMPDLRVMFHEPYFYFGWHPGRNALALAQRAMAAYLLRGARVAYISTAAWEACLRRYAPAGSSFVPLPIPATVDVTADAAAVARWRERLAPGGVPLIAHFGTYGDHVARELRPLVAHLLAADPRVRIACAGRGSHAFAAAFSGGGRVVAAGALGADEVPAFLRAADVAVQPYPDGVTTRRTTIMACLANGVSTVTTRGALTEPLWESSAAVRLSAAGDARAAVVECRALLDDAAGRQALGAAGRRLYEREFALERTLERLLRPAEGAQQVPA